jgi:hypothetical protein
MSTPSSLPTLESPLTHLEAATIVDATPSQPWAVDSRIVAAAKKTDDAVGLAHSVYDVNWADLVPSSLTKPAAPPRVTPVIATPSIVDIAKETAPRLEAMHTLEAWIAAGDLQDRLNEPTTTFAYDAEAVGEEPLTAEPSPANMLITIAFALLGLIAGVTTALLS